MCYSYVIKKDLDNLKNQGLTIKGLQILTFSHGELAFMVEELKERRNFSLENFLPMRPL